MHKTVATILLLFAFCLVVYPQAKNGRWLNGTWEGTAYQMDINETWTMKLNARRNRYTIDYPSLKCGGRWKLQNINSWTATFREHLSYGQDECVDQGRVVIQRLGNGQIAYRFYNRGAGRVTASATLNRKPRQ
ncbi:MAG: hypothetical protein M3539_15740 [Acidobacteriota bacterium]|nr:hypothetical protein [Acidobacteriota bacterium]